MADALPTVGGSNDVWGTELNNWLLVAHNADGTPIQLSTGVTWVNMASEEWGADPTGTTDCTSLIQAALNYLADTATAGVLYFPAGNYKQNGAVTYTSSQSLTIVGDGPGISVIEQNNSSSSIKYWTISNASNLAIRDLEFQNTAYSPSFADTNVSIYLSGLSNWTTIYNCDWQGGTTRVNQCVVLDNCTNVDIELCNMRSYVNSVVCINGSNGVTLRSVIIAQNAGSGVGTASGVLLNGNSIATIHLISVIFDSGDRAVYSMGGAGSSSTFPGFIWMYDVETNNESICALQLDTGGQLWAESCWFGGNSISNTENSMVVVSGNYSGCAYFNQCAFGGAYQHTVVLGGGQGYSFTDCTFGEPGYGKRTANTYDMLNIQDPVNYVTIHGCHFNTDAWYGIGGGNAPRSAVYVNSGANFIDVQGNLSLPNGSYGTSALVASSASYSNSPVNMPYND